MRTRRFAIAALVVAVAGLSATEAQGRGGRGHGRGQKGMCPQVDGQELGQRGGQRGAILEQLDLSDTQKEQLQALREEHRTEMQTMRQGGELDRESMQAIREEHRDAIQSLLTDEQKASLEEMRAQRGDMAHGPRGPRGFLRGADLTDAQKAELQELRESGDMDREAFRALREEHRKAAEAIVTGAQSEGTAKPAAAVKSSTWGRIKGIFH